MSTRANSVTSGVNGFSFSSTTIDDDTDRDYLNGAGTSDLFFRDTEDSIVDEVARGSVQEI